MARDGKAGRDQLDLVGLVLGRRSVDEMADSRPIPTATRWAAVEDRDATMLEVVDPVLGWERIVVIAPWSGGGAKQRIVLAGRRRVGAPMTFLGQGAVYSLLLGQPLTDRTV